MASSSETPPPTDTFLQMDRNDATLIGKHCAYDACNQLDFLPFLCQSCQQPFCLDHRTESSHRCARAGAWAERRRQADLAKPSLGSEHRMRDAVASKRPCAAPQCSTVIGTSLVTGVHCATCNRDYCLQHRLFEDHDCKNLVPIGARPSAESEVATRARSALDRLRAWGASRRVTLTSSSFSSPSSGGRQQNSAAARIMAVNKMKREAKGDEKLDQAKRIYLYVEAEASTTAAKLPRGAFFYSKDWVVGRVLDSAARSLQVENINNQSTDEEDRLRVFHVEGGRLLDFGEKLGEAVATGNTIVLLRGVGPPPDLIDL
jgi:predicted nucleic acid binding AN1-type Zn finger protein